MTAQRTITIRVPGYLYDSSHRAQEERDTRILDVLTSALELWVQDEGAFPVRRSGKPVIRRSHPHALHAVLRTIARNGGVSARDVARRLYPRKGEEQGYKAAYQLISKARKAGYLRAEKLPRIGKGGRPRLVYHMTRSGYIELARLDGVEMPEEAA